MQTNGSKHFHSSSIRRLISGIKGQELIIKVVTTFLLAAGSIFIITPFLYMVSTSLKDVNQLRSNPLAIIPTESKMANVAGKDEPLYAVIINGEKKEMALVKNLPEGKGIFVDPINPSEQLTLPIKDQKELRVIEIHWENYPKALTSVPFDRYILNTLLITFVTMAGMLFSCSMVAYGFSRFRAPGLNILFLVLLSTMMLPGQVRLIPMYVFFQKIGWVDSFLPLMVPAFFANAYDVFLLRQFIMTIPLEMDEAARIDGANPFQILVYIILPQARPALIAIAIFHFLWAWNDFYEPLIYLHSRSNWTMAIGLQTFDALYTVNTHLIMAASLVMIIPPIVLFFLAQKVFTQGVVFTGVKG